MEPWWFDDIDQKCDPNLWATKSRFIRLASDKNFHYQHFFEDQYYRMMREMDKNWLWFCHNPIKWSLVYSNYDRI